MARLYGVHLQSDLIEVITPRTNSVDSLPARDLLLNNTVRFFNKTLSTRSSRAAIDDLDAIHADDFQANT